MMITILKIAPGHKPERVTIPHTLEAMQEIVGGLIQAIYPTKMLSPWSAMRKASSWVWT